MKSNVRILALVLAVLMLVAVFAGCSKTADPSSSVEPSSSTEPSSSSAEPASSSAEPSASSVEPSASSVEPSASSVEPSASSVEPSVTVAPTATKAPTATATKAPTATATKKPTATATKKPTATATKKATATAVPQPKNVDLGGMTLTIRSWNIATALNSSNGGVMTKNSDKITNELIDAVTALEKEMNFTLKSDFAYADAKEYNTIKKAIQAGNKNIGQFVASNIPLALGGCAQGYYMDLNEIDAASTGFDISDNNRFWQDLTKLCVFNGKQYGVAIAGRGADSHPTLGIVWFFNKNVCTKAGYSPETIYNLVRNFKWSFAEAQAIMQKAYVADSNGDGSPEVWGLNSYCRQHKYYLQGGGDCAVLKNGKYVYSADSNAVLSVLNTLKDWYVTKKLAYEAMGGSGEIRANVLDGKTAFTQAPAGYIDRDDIVARMDDFNKNVGIIPSPVSDEYLAKKQYVNPVGNAEIMVCPVIFKGTAELKKAATAFAALADIMNDVEGAYEDMTKGGALSNKDNLEMWTKYIMPYSAYDPAYISEIYDNDDGDSISVLALQVTRGEIEPQAGVVKYKSSMQKMLDIIYKQ